MRLTLSIPDSQALSGIPGMMMDISPDGTRVVFAGDSASGRQLYLRHLSQPEAVLLPNTDDGFCPFFSHDGEWIAFGQKGRLRKISVLGGPATTICEAADLRGGSWGADGAIVFAPNRNSGIWRVPAAGGEPTKLTDAGLGEATPTHRWPQILPNGETAIYTATDKNSEYADAKIMALSLDTGEQKLVLHGGHFARYVPTGHLVFGRSGTLMAVGFDVQKLAAIGSPIPVLEGVLTAPTFGSLQCAFSQTGTLVLVGGSAGGDQELPIWIDREGKESPVSEHKRDYNDMRISPDGTRLAATIMDGANSDIWILELARDSFMRLTVDEAVDQNARWSPDGRWIIFTANRGKSNLNLFRQLADGTGDAERLTTSENPQIPVSLTPDGNVLVFTERQPKTDADIMYLRLDTPQASPEAFLATQFVERAPALSPDGKWIAYASNESGETEIYVRPFLRPGAKVKISAGRAFGPKWLPNGKELVYFNEWKIMTVPISIQDDVLQPSSPRQLFEVKNQSYVGPLDVSADGNRFLFIRPAGEINEQSQQPTVVVNWFEELKAKTAAQR
jgi:serine/threonine-protein kinase